MKSPQSDRMAYLGVMAPLLLAIVILVVLCIGGFHVLSAARAFVGGESLWSKARASAVAHLRAHAITGQVSEYRRFVDALAVPLGDRMARLELEKRQPNMGVVEAGFLAGENSQEDVAAMVRLYRYFRHTEFMQEAIHAWTEGDELIEELQRLGQRIHMHIERGDPPSSITPLLVDLDVLDGKLVTVEKYFSATLGRASRGTEQALVAMTVMLGLLLAGGGMLFVRRAMRLQLLDKQSLMEANQRWDMAADAAGLGLLDWHIAEDRIHLDERAAAFYGFPEGQPAVLKRAELRAMTHPDDQAFVRARVDQAVAQGGSLMERYRIVLPDGGTRHLECIARVSSWEDPAHARMVGILRDVGGEVTRAQLTVDKEAAERVARLRMEFLSRLSHELRTPLNAVLGVAQLLRIDPLEPLTVNQAKRVQILQESGEHLLRLVEDVLDVTRLDAGTIVMESVATDIVASVRNALTVVDPQRAANGIRIDDRMPQRSVLVRGDPRRLQQVFVNLLSNGCRYNSRGGTLSLTLGEDERMVWVGIADEGEGFTAQQLAELFQPFTQAGPSAEVGGTGLGLVVVKLLLEQMHGSVSVESQRGQGARFIVRMPRA